MPVITKAPIIILPVAKMETFHLLTRLGEGLLTLPSGDPLDLSNILQQVPPGTPKRHDRLLVANDTLTMVTALEGDDEQ